MRSLFLIAIVACAPDKIGNPIWEDVQLEGATDLGFAPAKIATPVAPGPITLVDVTASSGLAGEISGGNTHGVGVAFVDLTGDDWPDLFVANGQSEAGDVKVASKLYQNRGDGTFIDATVEWGLDAIADRDCFSVSAADYDNDGDVDLYVGSRPLDILLQNQGDRFVDVTESAGAGGPPSDETLFSDGRSKVVGFGDYDRDGWLDVVSASSTLPIPHAYLLRNRGDGTFEDVSSQVGVQAHPAGNPCAMMWSDFDNDRDPDLHIWNDRGKHILLENDDAHLVDATERAGLDSVDIIHPMGIDSADFDHDGNLDLYISNIGNNPLLRNNGDGTFTDITLEAGTAGTFGWGLGFEDFNLDGWVDIFVAQEDDLASLVFQNLGTTPPSFDRVLVQHERVKSTPLAHNKAVGIADFDRDGRADVLVAGTDGSGLQLLHNETEVGTNPYLVVSVMRGPSQGNLRAIGARVLVHTGDVLQFRDLTAGSSRASQNEHTVRFGLGDWSGADWVSVQWPAGGQRTVRNVEGQQRLMMEFE